jgi:hypothetical protein
MNRGFRESSGRRSVFLTLAMLALVLRVLVPQGFMVADQAAGPGLVICTGHGPLTLVSGDHGAKAPERKPVGQTACVFAGANTPPQPSPAAPVHQPLTLVLAAPLDLRRPDDRPVRGLTAPPPPSHAPPSVLI